MRLDKTNKLTRGTFFLLVFLLTHSLLIYTAPFAVGKNTTIVVPDDALTINMAIEKASPYDTILVKKGTYYENVLINKPLLIQGESSDQTTIIGTNDLNEGNVITLASNNITISDFTIQSEKYPSAKQHANAINIQGDNCTIINNRIKNSFWGILCAIQSSTLISQNNITGNLKEGIRFYGGSKNKISENYINSNTASAIAIEGYSNIITKNHISHNTRGIGVGTSYSIIHGNQIINHGESGLYFSGSNNIIFNNLISESEYGIYFPPDFAAPNNNLFYKNNFVDNNNNIHVSSIYNLNSWNNTDTGNYWSNYAFEYPEAKEVTGLGIGDTPYVIDINNADYHPLIEPVDIVKDDQPLTTPQPKQANNGAVSLWSFDEVKPNLVSEDSIGDNHAILGSFSGEINYTPDLVEGKFDNCLSFDGRAFVYVPASPTLEIQEEVTIEAWIYVKEFNNIDYNNILIQSTREEKSYPRRVMGLAFNGLEPNSSMSLPMGALRGYVTTDVDGFNEIASSQSVIKLEEWIHVVFVRSLESGMALYVNGEEVGTKVIQGIQNPRGLIERSTYFYLGHDSITLLDEISISNVASKSLEPDFSLDLDPIVIVVAMVIIIIGIGLFVYYRKLKKAFSRVNKMWIIITFCSLLVYDLYWLIKNDYSLIYPDPFSSVSVLTAYLLPVIGEIFRFLAVSLAIYTAYLVWGPKNKPFSNVKKKVSIALLFEAAYLLLLLPGNIVGIVNFGIYPIYIGFTSQILLVSPLLILLAAKVWRFKQTAKKNMLKWVGITATGYLIGIWLNNVIKWVTLTDVEGAGIILGGFTSVNFLTAIILLSLSLIFTIIGFNALIKQENKRSGKLWLAAGLITLGLYYVTFIIYSILTDATAFIILSEIWPVTVLGLGLNMLKEEL